MPEIIQLASGKATINPDLSGSQTCVLFAHIPSATTKERRKLENGDLQNLQAKGIVMVEHAKLEELQGCGHGGGCRNGVEVKIFGGEKVETMDGLTLNGP